MSNIIKIDLNFKPTFPKKSDSLKRKILSHNYKSIPINGFNLTSFIKNNEMKDTKNLFYIKLDKLDKEQNLSLDKNPQNNLNLFQTQRSNKKKLYVQSQVKSKTIVKEKGQTDFQKTVNVFKKTTLNPINLGRSNNRYKKISQSQDEPKFYSQLIGSPKFVNLKQKKPVRAAFNRRSIQIQVQSQNKKKKDEIFTPWAIDYD